MDAKTQSKKKQDEEWARRYDEIVREFHISLATRAPDNSSLVQPSPYEDVPSVFTTSAGDEPIVG